MPLLHFTTVLENLVEIEERQLQSLAREKLLLEAEAFQGDLSPEKFVENCLQQMNNAFKFSATKQGGRILQYPNGYDPELINNEFIASASAYLKSHYGFSPAIFIAADCDLQNYYHHYDPGILEDPEIRKDFTRLAILSGAFDQTYLRNILPDTKNLEKFRHDSLSNIEAENFHLEFIRLFKNHVSFFSNPERISDLCTKIFSNHFGSQRAYNYTYKIQRFFPDNWEGLYGIYYLVILGKEISPVSILKSALKQPSEVTQRGIVRMKLSKPHFKRTARGIYYFANLTSPWSQTIDDYSLSKPEIEKPMKEFFRNHALCVFIDQTNLTAKSRVLLPWLWFLQRLIVLVFFTFSIRFLLLPENFAAGLNWKLRLIISVIVMLPVSLIFATIHLVDTASDQTQLVKAQAIMQRQLRQFEHLENELSNRITVRFQHKKKIDAALMAQKNPELDRMQAMHKKYGNDNLGMFGLYLDRTGNALSFERSLKSHNRGRKAVAAGLFRILGGLGFTDSQASKIRKLTKDQYLFGSFADAFWNVFATPEALASENEIVHDFFSVSTLKHSLFQLLTTPEKPNQPFGIFLHEINDAQKNREMIEFYKNQQLLKPSISLENGIIDFGIFVRSTFALQNEHWPNMITGSNELKDLAKWAISMRSSGSSTEKDGRATKLKTWIFRESRPTVFVAQAQILPNSKAEASLNILAWLVLLYGLLTIFLISEALAKIFFGPVNLLLKGVEQIESRRHGFALEISGNDEFAELAQSFNRMNNGLIQREKMRRFVSDKLLENLDRGSGKDSQSRMLEIVVLSSDIRDFTTLTEKSLPEEIVRLLNDYLTRMEQAIRRHGGSIEKIVGDAITATFSTRESGENMKNACLAGLAMRKALEEFNRERKTHGLKPIENGVGIATSSVIVGIAGKTQRRREMVMVGQAFQAAEKLESASKFANFTKVIVAQEVKDVLKNDFNFQAVASEDNENRGWEITA